MNPLNEDERQQLIDAALSAQRRAYAAYSGFQVGAALLHANGQIFTGANVENASYGLTLCAERVAAAAAVTSTETLDPRWRAIAVASRTGVTPCGACRQFLMEFAPEMEVLLVDSERRTIQGVSVLRDLLPGAFEFKPHLRKSKP